jgi:hypothetical protein
MTEQRLITINLATELIKEAINTQISLNTLCVNKGRRRNFVANLVWELRNGEVPSDKTEIETISNLLSLYDEYLENKARIAPDTESDSIKSYDDLLVEYDSTDDEEYDERSVGESIRGNEELVLGDGKTRTNKIVSYKYNIKIKNRPDLEGEFTREEMDSVYRLYSNMDGAGLTQRVVSRYFPSLTFVDFKRILRAFNITKSSHPFAPHVLEENPIETVIEIVQRNKENNYFKKFEEERGKNAEKSYVDVLRELTDLKAKMSDWKSMINRVVLEDIQPFKIEQKITKDDRALIVYLSDMHVGAETKKDSLYNNHYDKEEFNNRLRKTVSEIVNQYETFGRFDRIIICNLGDSLDGYNGGTTRGGHGLPQNMDNKGQYNTFVNGMITLFETLYDLDMANAIDYNCVGDANHDGDFGYVANRTLEVYFNVKYPEMKVNIFEKYIENFEYGSHTFILLHGKDKEDNKNGLPLDLNDKVETYFNDYIHNASINSKYIHVVSGDLHQTSVNYAKRFRWKKVSSLYGCSKWIQTNFGNSKAAVDFEIVNKDSGTILEGRLMLI